MSSNSSILRKGFAKGIRDIELLLRTSLHWAAVELVYTALHNRTFTSFTGNTQTSYMCGIYVNGRLVEVVDSSSDYPNPVRHKVHRGQRVFLPTPYEGKARSVTGTISTDGGYGSETSLKFLSSYRAPRKGIALVMTTGTEYSEYIEVSRGLDVLTKTYNDAPKILSKNWRKIRD